MVQTVDEILEQVRASIEARNSVECPRCHERIDMTDSDRTMHHVSYWGEDGPALATCPHCDGDIFIKEHVERHWTAGITEEDANDL